MKIPYGLQDALSLLVMDHRPIGHGVGCIRRQTANRLIERSYAAIRADGELEVTEEGRVQYDAALRRAHADGDV